MKKKMAHVMLSVVMLLGLLFGNGSFAADKFTRQDVQIKSNGLNMAGWLYIPNG